MRNIIYLRAIIVFLVLLAWPVLVQSSWTREIRLTSDSAFSSYPVLSSLLNDNIAMIWLDSREISPFRHQEGGEIYCTILNNFGRARISQIKVVSVPNSYVTYRAISAVVDINNVIHIVAIKDDTNAVRWEIKYIRVASDCTPIQETTVASYGGYSTTVLRTTAVKATQDFVYMAWVAPVVYNDEIYIQRYDLNGNRQGDTIRATSTLSVSRAPTIGVDGDGNIHLTWIKQEGSSGSVGFYKKIRPDGSEIVHDFRIIERTKTQRFALDSEGNVHLAFVGTVLGNYGVFYAKLNNAGQVSIPPRQLVFYHRDPQDVWRSMNIAIDKSDGVHLVWIGSLVRGFENEIYYMKLDRFGEILVPETRLTYKGEEKFSYPFTSASLTTDSNNVPHVAYVDLRELSQFDVFYKRQQAPATIMLQPSQSPIPGNSLTLTISAPTLAGEQYFVFLSFTSDVGFTALRKQFPLDFDALFFLTATGSFGNSFNGVLDSQGRANAYFQVPIGVPEGTSLYASVAIYQPSTGRIAAVSNPVHIVIRDRQ